MPSLKSTLGNSKHISLDDVCYLLSVSFEKDELEQDIETEVERQVFCSVLGVTRQEFLTAGQLGLKPQIVIVVDHDEYDGETDLIYNGKKHTVYRNFPRPDGYIELSCEVRVGD